MPLEASTTRESCFAAFNSHQSPRQTFSQIFPFVSFGVIKLQGYECQALMRDRQVICPRHQGSWESSTLSTSKPTAENAGTKTKQGLEIISTVYWSCRSTESRPSPSPASLQLETLETRMREHRWGCGSHWPYVAVTAIRCYLLLQKNYRTQSDQKKIGNPACGVCLPFVDVWQNRPNKLLNEMRCWRFPSWTCSLFRRHLPTPSPRPEMASGVGSSSINHSNSNVPMTKFLLKTVGGFWFRLHGCGVSQSSQILSEQGPKLISLHGFSSSPFSEHGVRASVWNPHLSKVRLHRDSCKNRDPRKNNIPLERTPVEYPKICWKTNYPGKRPQTV